MSRLVSKLPHTRAWYCYGKKFLEVIKDSIIHSIVHIPQGGVTPIDSVVTAATALSQQSTVKPFE